MQTDGCFKQLLEAMASASFSPTLELSARDSPAASIVRGSRPNLSQGLKGMDF
jgi:hypothetical protein